MPDTSPNLALPYLLPAQAQKHVTHNEALARLDLLVQLVVAGFDALTPPATPAAGDIHALGAAPLGDWAGQGGKLAAWDGAAWGFVAPREGWRAWGLIEGELRVWRGGAWVLPAAAAPLMLDGLEGLGVGTAHDATNRLAVVAPATLLTHAGAGHQVKVNKATVPDTASLLFQSNWSGRAEMGLAGNDDFSLKVSADGGSWLEALLADRTTGRLRLPGGARLPDGSAASPALAFDAGPNTGLFRSAANALGLATAGVQRALLSGSALQLDVPLTGTAVTQSASDATAGRVLKVGDFGLGGQAILLTSANDLNAITASGTYYWTSGSVPLNAPGAFFASMRHEQVGATRAIQTVTRVGSVASTNGIVHARTNDLGTWYGWQVQYARGNVLGSVTQAAGVPTGALIERASNANGEYMRFADGTQICNKTVTASASADVTWTFPAAFVTAVDMFVAASAVSGTDAIFGQCRAPSSTAVAFNVWSTSGTRQPLSSRLIAIGRWF